MFPFEMGPVVYRHGHGPSACLLYGNHCFETVLNLSKRTAKLSHTEIFFGVVF